MSPRSIVTSHLCRWASLWLVGLCCVTAPSTPALGQTTMQWAARTFTARDGIAHDIVRDVLVDDGGIVWLATMGGVTRFEPQRCSYQTLVPGASKQAMALARTPDGAIWVGTQGGGVAVYRHGKWRTYTTRDGLPSDEVTSLMVDGAGAVWATPTIGGLARFAGGRWRAFGPVDGLSPGEIGACTALRAGPVLCGTYERPLLQRFDGRRFSQLKVDVPLRQPFYVHALAEAGDGGLWLATKGAGVIEGRPVAGGGYSFTVHGVERGLPSNRVGAVRVLPDGGVWAATSAGAARFDGRTWQALPGHGALGANLIFAITPGKEGSLWFATLGGGAVRYSPSRWRRDDASLPSANITGGLLRSSDGSIWAGTDRGLARRRPGGRRWKLLPTGDDALDFVDDLAQASDGTLWVATRGGLGRRDGQRFVRVGPQVTGEESPVVRRIAVGERAGRPLVWAVTDRGVLAFDGRGFRPYLAGLPSTRVNDLLVDRGGTLWAATANGIGELVGERWRAHLSPRPASRTNRFYSLVQDEAGRIWASGLESVVRYERGAWRTFAGSWGLPPGIYSRFAMGTADGSLWFAVRGLGLRRLWRGRWTRYSTAEGLPPSTVRDVIHLADGSFLFATLGEGISRYQPDRRAPQTWIGRSREGAPSSALRGERLVISFGGQDVYKDTPTASLLYSHRVDGGAWSHFAPATSARLDSLAAGEHLFEVRAMDRDLNVDGTPAHHRFRVLHPWWAEPWLLTLLGLSLVLVAYAVTRIIGAIARERVAMQREHATVEQRQRFVRLASHELRKPVARLAHRAEIIMLPGTLDDRDKLGAHARALVEDSGRLSRLVESLLHQTKVKEGLQLGLTRGDLALSVKEVVARFVEENPGAGPTLRLPDDPLPADYDALYLELALHNLLDNASKYAGPLSDVTVEAARRADRAAVMVRDRGPGIAPDQRAVVFEPFHRGARGPEHGGFGLGLGFAREIARAHGGDLVLDENPDGVGCAFTITLPLAQDEA